MRITVEKAPAFCMEHRVFDILTTPQQIAVYAYIARQICAYEEIYLNDFLEKMKISSEEADNTISILISVNIISYKRNFG